MKSVNANPDEEISIRLEYINYNETTVKDVYCDIILPDQLELVPGTLVIYTWKHPNGLKLSDDRLQYINIGDYVPYEKALLTFNVKIREETIGTATTILRTRIIVQESSRSSSEDFVDLNVYIPSNTDTWREERMG